MKLTQSDIDFLFAQLTLPGNNPLNSPLAGNVPASAELLPVGIRDTQGIGNNVANPTWGAADQPFVRLTNPTASPTSFQLAQGTFSFGPQGQLIVDPTPTSYAVRDVNLIDTTPRTISNLVADQSAPALASIGYVTPGQQAEAVLDNPDTTVGGRLNPFTGADNPLPASTFTTMFGQFFDHGLDFVHKGADGQILIPLLPGDPLYVEGSHTNFMIASRTNTVHVDIAETSTDLLITRLGLGSSEGVRSGEAVTATPTFQNTVGNGNAGVLMLNNVAINITGGMNLAAVVTAINEVAVTTGVTATVNAGNLVLTPAANQSINTTSPFIDLSQSYGSDPSHTVFVREYDVNGDVTGALLSGSAGGMATWKDVKDNAARIGITLIDKDVLDIPEVRMNADGSTFFDGNGNAWLVARHMVSGAVYYVQDSTIADNTTVLDANGNAVGGGGLDAVKTQLVLQTLGHAFLDDIAHSANLVDSQTGQLLAADADSIAGIAAGKGFYDNELLDAHFVAGDGRTNENIGLTSIHDVFHAEHNRVLAEIKVLVEARNALDPADPAYLAPWTGEQYFQAAKLVTEMEYQHLVFGEFTRKLSPNINAFAAYDVTIDPAITAEFAHAVYRFGHSMLTETVPLASFDPVTGLATGVDNSIGLIEAFLNPLAYSESTAGEFAIGGSQQVANGIDIWVTDALRNNLVGLPLDLATLNIVRGRDTGMLTLNGVRADLFSQTGDAALKAYANWSEFGANIVHQEALENFMMAYSADALKELLPESILLSKVLANADAPSNNVDLATVTVDSAAGWRSLKALDLGVYNTQFDAQKAVLQGVPHSQVLTGLSEEQIQDLIVAKLGAVAVTTGSVTLDSGGDWAALKLVNLSAYKTALTAAGALLTGGAATATPDEIAAAILDNLGGVIYIKGDVDGTFQEVTTVEGVKALSVADFAAAELRAAARIGYGDAYFMTRDTGVDRIDLWVGGLAETKVAGGMLGSTFDFVFAMQMVELQNADRFYYLNRLAGTNVLAEIEAQMFSDIVMRNTGVQHLYKDIFSVPDAQVEIGTDVLKTFGTTYAHGIYTTSVTDLLGTPQKVGVAGYVNADGTYYGNPGDYLDARGIFSPNGKGQASEVIGGTNGADKINSLGGNDSVWGDGGNDNIEGGLGNDYLMGGDGNDVITDSSGDDLIWGDAGDDHINAGGGLDQVFGGEGDDTLYGGFGGDVMDGQGGDDVMYGDNGAAVNGVMDPVGDADIMAGGDGNDTMYGGGGTDLMDGGEGSDTLSGGIGADSLTGWNGDDLFLMDASDKGVGEAIDGGTGFDTVDYSASLGSLGLGVNVDMNPVVPPVVPVGGLPPDVLTNVERVIGTQFADTIRGGADLALLLGLQLDENNIAINFGTVNAPVFRVMDVTIEAGAGNDTLIGGDGNDVLDGGTGNDNMTGGLGDDVYLVDAAGDVVTEAAAAGTDRVEASRNFTLGANLEDLGYTGSATFTGTGNALNNVIDAGGATSSTLSGLAGDDTLTGGSGVDTLIGGTGADTLTGGAGADVFQFAVIADSGITAPTRDLITDFVAGADKIDVSRIDGNTQLGGAQQFNFIGTAAFSGNGAAQIRYAFVGGQTVIQGSNDADTAIEFSIALAGNVTLTYADFIGVVSQAPQTINGNGNNNVLTGGAGNDTINGNDGRDSLSGGLGNDTLTGGAGADTFVFDTALGVGNVDRITDFSVANDSTINLSRSVFTTIGNTGNLANAAFKNGTLQNWDASDRVLYERATGNLYYDADGSGNGSQAVLFATLNTNLNLTSADFRVIA